MSTTSYREVARFPSSSSAGKVYVVKEDQDGNLSCDCPAWRFKKPGRERTCKHTQMAARGDVGIVPQQTTPPPATPAGEVVEGLMAEIDSHREPKGSPELQGNSLVERLREMNREGDDNDARHESQ